MLFFINFDAFTLYSKEMNTQDFKRIAYFCTHYKALKGRPLCYREILIPALSGCQGVTALKLSNCKL